MAGTSAETELRPHGLKARATIAVLLGVAMTLVVRGYRFGESNHSVYLVDAIRRADPSLLERDWWVQSTLQYHFVFNALTAGLLRIGLLEPAFLVGYLALAVLLHVAWRKITVRLGGDDGTYLLSVILYYLLAGGVGLGMYHFLQDSAFLPSNVANVAMLWAVYFWIAGMPASAGICLGIAGLFHINHALAGIGLWAGASVFEKRRGFTRGWWLGTFALLAFSVVQIVAAARVVLARSGKLPLDEFVDLFVRLRHPHHFDPLAWHWCVWLSFLLPLPLAVVAFRRTPGSEERRRAAVLFGLFNAMLAFALLFAGFWFAGETFVQLNLYRFSIYPKLLGCVGAAWLLWEVWPAGKRYVIQAVSFSGFGLCVAVAVMIILTGTNATKTAYHNLLVATLFAALAVVSLVVCSSIPRRAWRGAVAVMAAALGWFMLTNWYVPTEIRLAGLHGDDAPYLEVVHWARDHTPKDALFLVPPDEESLRVHGRRAIVVNFKGVPQLGAELPEWRDRLCRVLDTDTSGLLAMPRPMGKTLGAIRARYDALPPQHHFDCARHFGARYVVLSRQASTPAGVRLVYSDSNARYFLYDLRPGP